MAHKCDGTWDSWVFRLGTAPSGHPTITRNDGEIIVDPESSSGEFGGRHEKPSGTLTGRLKEGKCKESPKHTIDFKREEGNCKYHYKGEITQEVIDGVLTDVVRGGTRKKTCTGPKRAATATDEDWVAEKTT